MISISWQASALTYWLISGQHLSCQQYLHRLVKRYHASLLVKLVLPLIFCCKHSKAEPLEVPTPACSLWNAPARVWLQKMHSDTIWQACPREKLWHHVCSSWSNTLQLLLTMAESWRWWYVHMWLPFKSCLEACLLTVFKHACLCSNTQASKAHTDAVWWPCNKGFRLDGLHGFSWSYCAARALVMLCVECCAGSTVVVKAPVHVLCLKSERTWRLLWIQSKGTLIINCPLSGTASTAWRLTRADGMYMCGMRASSLLGMECALWHN